ncbi:IclR family transcriptional regulator [Leucobacter weissii]|uniref:IclR family transcriptional regulator n=1 Tax=Leucobacter weissii TaxID=1983706 RepID=A0A939SBF3_9MICO|nr:IclR family transcriptional regulator [Leucobacter weissii]MBO1901318.1 IclR family transcriptional regulator [Leucobacter weissii]
MSDGPATLAGEPEQGKRRRHPLARGIELLTMMVDSDQDVHGVRELAGRLGVSPSTVHRLITDLESLGLVSRTAHGSYRLGLEFLRLAWTTVDRYPLQEVSTDTLQELTEQSGESSFFAVYGESRHHMMFSLTVESPHPLRYTLPLKQWIPLYAGASGLAILAYLPDDIVDEVVNGRIEALTDRTLVDPAELRARLATISKEGYAITHGERIEGAIAIASPLFGPSGNVVGSIGISMPEARFNAAYSASLASLVTQAAGRITQYLTGDRDPRTGIVRR